MDIIKLVQKVKIKGDCWNQFTASAYYFKTFSTRS